MQRIGQWQKAGAALGLFALVLQLWLSFGHVHAEGVAAAHFKTDAQSQSDDHHGGQKLERDLCAICVTAQLLASWLPAPATVLCYLPKLAAADPTPPAPRNPTGTALRRYLARAPPLV